MSLQPNPYALFLLNALASGTQNTLQGLSQGLQQYKQDRMTQEAIDAYTQDPSMQNLINLSKFIDVDKVARASANIQASQQQQQAFQGLNEVAEQFNLPPNFVQAIAQHPQLFQLLLSQQPQPQKPLDHLSQEEQKIFLGRQENIDKRLEKAQLARALRSAQDVQTAEGLAKRLDINVSKAKNINDYRELARQVQESEYRAAVRDHVASILDGRQDLSPQERNALRREILANPTFFEGLEEQIRNAVNPQDGRDHSQDLFTWTENVVNNLLGDYTQTAQDLSALQQIIQLAQQQGYNQGLQARTPGSIQLPTPQSLETAQIQEEEAAQQERSVQEQLTKLAAEAQKKQAEEEKQKKKIAKAPVEAPQRPTPPAPKTPLQAPQKKTVLDDEDIAALSAPQEEIEAPEQEPEQAPEVTTQPQEPTEVTEQPKKAPEKAPEQQVEPEEAPTTQEAEDEEERQVNPILRPSRQREEEQTLARLQQQPVSDETPAKEDKFDVSVSTNDKGERSVIKFPRFKIQFRQNIRKNNPEYNHISTNDLDQYWENRQKIAYAKSGQIFIDDLIRKQFNYLAPTKTLRNQTELRNQRKLRDEKLTSLKAALIEEGFHKRMPFADSEGLANQALAAIPSEQLTQLLDRIDSKKSFENTVADIINGTKTSLVDVLDKTAPDWRKRFIDTLAIGGAQAAMAYFDSLLSRKVLSKALTLVADPGVAKAILLAEFIGSTYSYYAKSRRQFEDSKTWESFFTTPRTAAEEAASYNYRKIFADRFEDEIGPQLRSRIISNNLLQEDIPTVARLLNKQSILTEFFDYVSGPVSSYITKNTPLYDQLQSNFSDPYPSLVLGAQTFGALKGQSSNHMALLNKTLKSINTGVVYKDGVSLVLDKGVKQLAKGVKSNSQAGKYFNNIQEFIRTKGNSVFQNYVQVPWYRNPGWIAPAGGAIAVTAGDYLLDKQFEATDLTRSFIAAGITSGVAALNDLSFRDLHSRVIKDVDFENNMLKKMAQDTGGFSKYDEKTGKTQHFLRNINKRITYDDIGKVTDVSDWTPPATPLTKGAPEASPYAPVSFNEYSNFPQYSPISYFSLASTLKIQPPNFSRSRRSSTTLVDVDEVAKYLNQSRDTLREAIWKNRNEDLSELFSYKDEKFKPENYTTKNLKEAATAAYARFDNWIKNEPIDSNHGAIKGLLADLNAFIKVNEATATPELGSSRPFSAIEDIKNIVSSPDFYAEELIKKRRQINKNIRSLQKDLTKAYDENKKLLLDQYSFIRAALDESFRKINPYASAALQKGDDLYRAYKYSETVDNYLRKLQVIDSLQSWEQSKTFFEKEKQDLFYSLRDRRTLDSIKKALLFEDFTQIALRGKNIALVQDKKVIKPSEISESASEEFLKAVSGGQLAAFSSLGKVARIADLVKRKSGAYLMQKVAKEAAQGSPFLVSAEMQDSFKEFSKLFNTRHLEANKGFDAEQRTSWIAKYHRTIAQASAQRRAALIRRINENQFSLNDVTRELKSNFKQAPLHLSFAAVNSATVKAIQDLFTYQEILKNELDLIKSGTITKASRIKPEFRPEVERQLHSINEFIKENNLYY